MRNKKNAYGTTYTSTVNSIVRGIKSELRRDNGLDTDRLISEAVGWSEWTLKSNLITKIADDAESAYTYMYADVTNKLTQ